jgi:hypothetical protein
MTVFEQATWFAVVGVDSTVALVTKVCDRPSSWSSIGEVGDKANVDDVQRRLSTECA